MRIIDRTLPADGVATKYLQETADGFIVEATYIKRPKKHILCVSTQVGCLIRCRFCASGLRSKGALYERSLSSAEMVEECSNIAREIDLVAYHKPIHFSFMGEGEPFLNFGECVKAFHVLTSMNWLVPVQIAVSTSGIRPDLIRRLSQIEFLVPFKLQVSLHGASDEIRSRIVPITKPITEIVAATRYYREKCSRPVEWNYVMCSGVNDSLEHAELLVELLGPGWYVKFSQLNLTAGLPFLPASRERVDQFRQILENNGLSTKCYKTDESGIGSGCGQLSYHYVQQKASL